MMKLRREALGRLSSCSLDFGMILWSVADGWAELLFIYGGLVSKVGRAAITIVSQNSSTENEFFLIKPIRWTMDA